MKSNQNNKSGRIALVGLISITFILIFSMATFATENGRFSDQGTGVINITSGLPMDGNLTVFVYSNSTGGTPIYNESFVDAVVAGNWNVMLGENVSIPLSLEYGRLYHRDYEINGRNVNFTNSSGQEEDRKSWQSPLGQLNDINMTGDLNMADGDIYLGEGQFIEFNRGGTSNGTIMYSTSTGLGITALNVVVTGNLKVNSTDQSTMFLTVDDVVKSSMVYDNNSNRTIWFNAENGDDFVIQATGAGEIFFTGAGSNDPKVAIDAFYSKFYRMLRADSVATQLWFNYITDDIYLTNSEPVGLQPDVVVSSVNGDVNITANNINFDGTISGLPSTFWNRTGTTIIPAIAGDDVQITGGGILNTTGGIETGGAIISNFGISALQIPGGSTIDFQQESTAKTLHYSASPNFEFQFNDDLRVIGDMVVQDNMTIQEDLTVVNVEASGNITEAGNRVLTNASTKTKSLSFHADGELRPVSAGLGAMGDTPVLTYDDTGSEYSLVAFRLPADMDLTANSTMRVSLAPVSAQSVGSAMTFEMDIKYVANGEALSKADDESLSNDITVSNTAAILTSSDYTLNASLMAANDLVSIRLIRNGGAGGDDRNGDGGIVLLEFEYTAFAG